MKVITAALRVGDIIDTSKARYANRDGERITGRHEIIDLMRVAGPDVAWIYWGDTITPPDSPPGHYERSIITRRPGSPLSFHEVTNRTPEETFEFDTAAEAEAVEVLAHELLDDDQVDEVESMGDVFALVNEEV